MILESLKRRSKIIALSAQTPISVKMYPAVTVYHYHALAHFHLHLLAPVKVTSDDLILMMTNRVRGLKIVFHCPLLA